MDLWTKDGCAHVGVVTWGVGMLKVSGVRRFRRLTPFTLTDTTRRVSTSEPLLPVSVKNLLQTNGNLTVGVL